MTLTKRISEKVALFANHGERVGVREWRDHSQYNVPIKTNHLIQYSYSK